MWNLLTSRLAGPIGLAVGLTLLIALVGTTLSKDGQIKDLKDAKAKVERSLSLTEKALATARLNTLKLEGALKECNISAEQAAKTADVVAKAGLAAVEQVRQAQRGLDREIDRINAMPSSGATPAQVCEQADAILLQGASQ